MPGRLRGGVCCSVEARRQLLGCASASPSQFSGSCVLRLGFNIAAVLVTTSSPCTAASYCALQQLPLSAVQIVCYSARHALSSSGLLGAFCDVL